MGSIAIAFMIARRVQLMLPVAASCIQKPATATILQRKHQRIRWFRVLGLHRADSASASGNTNCGMDGRGRWIAGVVSWARSSLWKAAIVKI